jgi:hypothetical protein
MLHQISKYFYTLKYLKWQQIIGQIRKKLVFKDKYKWNYIEHGFINKNIGIFIPALDLDNHFLARFKVNDILQGKMELLHEQHFFDGSDWDDKKNKPLWNFNLNYFEFAVPLGVAYIESHDECWLDCFMGLYKKWLLCNPSAAWQPYTISLRFRNILIAVEMFGNDFKQSDLNLLYDSLYEQYAFLQKHTEGHLLGNHYFENLCTIVLGAVLFDEKDNYQKWIPKLIHEIDEEVLPDGMHFELSPMYQKIVLEDLLRVSVVMKIVYPDDFQRLRPAIQKMLNASCFLETGCNRTLLFNDSGDNVAKPLSALVRACKEIFGLSPHMPEALPEAGYYRLQKKDLILLVDAGYIGPDYIPGHVHCDCMSFELFHQGRPLLVNSGTGLYQGKLRGYFRSTAAHNTVRMNGHEQSECWAEHRVARRIRLGRVEFDKDELRGAYQNYFGEKHSRYLKLNKNRLTVEDRIDAVAGAAVESYLHIAPEFQVKDDGMVVSIYDGQQRVATVRPNECHYSIDSQPYAPEFGQIQEATVLVFVWSGMERHGYTVEFEQV